MSLYILDTDMLTLMQQGHVRSNNHWLACVPPDEIVVTVISVEEQLNGWYRLLRQKQTRPQLVRVYQRMTDVAEFLSHFRLLSYTASAMDRFDQLVALKLNIGKNDQRIAAIALEAGGIVVTRNRRDFGRVPGLVLEDWSV